GTFNHEVAPDVVVARMNDLEVDILRHPLGELVGAAQGRATTEYEAKLTRVDARDRGQRLGNVPVLFNQPRARQLEVLLHFKQLFEGRLTVQGQAPYRRSADGVKIGPSP